MFKGSFWQEVSGCLLKSSLKRFSRQGVFIVLLLLRLRFFLKALLDVSFGICKGLFEDLSSMNLVAKPLRNRKGCGRMI